MEEWDGRREGEGEGESWRDIEGGEVERDTGRGVGEIESKGLQAHH